MLWRHTQWIIRLFMIVALIVATIPHGHATLSHDGVRSTNAAPAQPLADHDHDDHDHDPAPTKNGWDHCHGATTADHVHDKPFPAQDLAVPACPPDANWCAASDDECTNAPSARLERPPRRGA
jgi:hypothetical protein